ncbi:MAG: S9 family peptidase [Halobacteriales archaeon]
MAQRSDTDALEALASLPTFHHPTVSPDGSRVALYYDETGRNELHVIDVETGERTRWSDGEVPRNARWFVAWGADGQSVFFHRDEHGDEQNDIYRITEAGAVEPVVTLDGQSIIHDVGQDGSTILVGSTRDGQLNVYRHDLESDETTKLTEYDRAVWTSLLSPDGETIAYSTNETDDYDNRDVYLMAVDGSDPRNLELGEVGSESMPADWSPDGGRLLVNDNADDLIRLGIYDLETGDVTWYGDLEHEEMGVAFLADGRRVLAARQREATTVPVVYDLETGEGRELDLPEGVATVGAFGAANPVVDTDRIVLQHTTPTRRPELLRYELSADEATPLLEAEYGPFDPTDFADATYFTVTSDGVPQTPARAVELEPAEALEIEALLYDSGERPSPLIVNPHGGPRSRDAKAFDLYTQVLAAQGYSVLQVNYRGSTGRGRAFVEALIGDWGGAEQGDVAVATEAALERFDWLDADRVAVFGGSYGGYSAYWQMVQYPDLYDAGIAWIGLTDLEDMFENTMPHFRTELMEKYLGSPEDHPELYVERSPVTHVENVDAPLLLLHGVADHRVPVSQARIFREALREAGYAEGEDFEYVELGEEGHASTDIEQKHRTFELLVDFLSRRFA